MQAEDTAKDLSDPANFKPGLYVHYKGGVYLAEKLVKHHEGGALFVVYVSMSSGCSFVREWATPDRDSWVDMVPYRDKFGNLTGELVPRFVYGKPAYLAGR